MTFSRLARLAGAVALVLLAADASAQSLDDAKAAFAEGRFLEAADLAEAVGTSDGYALAARSLAVHGYYVADEEDRKGLFERAMEMGEKAIRADSTNAEAHFQMSHAVGRFAQIAGTMTALREGLGGKARELIETALVLDPDLAGAHMALGSWHADVAKAGRVARWMYGGNREEAVAHYERALELAPASKEVLLHYARRLPYLDEEAGTERAMEMLSKALELPVRDAYGDFVHFEVLDALDALEGR